ncbi:MAG TPA: DNA starvation/stationary phase protection protein [Candidatus Kapabacteria bacterium]|nr:DNA starvation/stationary phase protection protein [Candidatus Kapabacteria bacterium]
MKYHIQLDDTYRDEACRLLNTLVANYTIHFHRLLVYHWNLTGEHFFLLHEQFERFYRDAQIKIDALAERIVSLGGTAGATLGEVVEKAALKETPKIPEARDMMEQLARDYIALAQHMHEIIHHAEEGKDEGTVDLVGGFLAEIEKHNWMVNAWLSDQQ